MAEETRTTEAGFTLVELSIVLVIIGLLVSGVLVGQNLIQGATIRSQIKQIEDLNTTVNAFRDKYRFLPGDITTTRSNRWGLANSNGDGDGLLTAAAGDLTAYDGEIQFFWVHLGQAEMVNTNFIVGTVIGDSFPEARIGRGGIVVGSDSGFNWWLLAANTGANMAAIVGNTLTSEEALTIDEKMDDGLPSTGTVLTTRINAGALARAANDGATVNDCTSGTGANYNMAVDTNPVCGLQLRMN